jgi:predicted transcriptional regulator
MDQTTNTLKQSEDGSTHFNAMPVMIRGVLYQSHKEAAAALGVSPSAISQRLKTKGTAETVGLGVSSGMYGNTNRAVPITILGCEFPSRTIAAEELGITRSQLTKWISPKASNSQKEMLMLSVMKYRQKRDKQ